MSNKKSVRLPAISRVRIRSRGNRTIWKGNNSGFSMVINRIREPKNSPTNS